METGRVELVSSVLFDLETAGVVTVDETVERTVLAAYFNHNCPVEELRRRIEGLLSRSSLTAQVISVADVPDQDWMQKWKDGYEPVRIGDRLLVAPSWKAVEPAEGVAVVRIDPGMAFGTGTHETTLMCLEAIDQCWRSGRLLDVGTGTGIIAIAAAKLGLDARIVAIDIDPVAVSVAAQNVEINEVTKQVTVVEGEPRDFRNQNFDFVVANLTAETIIDIVHDLVGCIAPGGLLVVSGILIEYSADVESALASEGLSVTNKRELGEWTALVAKQS